MRPQAWFRVAENWRALRGAATRLTAIAAAVVILLCFDIGGALSNPGPGRTQTRPAATAPVCAASEGLKNIPPALRAHLFNLVRDTNAGNCSQAVNVLAPLRDQLRDAYESAKPASLANKFVGAATDYVNAYFTHGLSKSGVVVPPDTLTRGLWRKGCDAES
jgi:hypothetical protein